MLIGTLTHSNRQYLAVGKSRCFHAEITVKISRENSTFEQDYCEGGDYQGMGLAWLFSQLGIDGD